MKDRRARRAALLRLLAGAVLISFSPVWVTLTDVGPTASAFYRVAVGGVLLLGWVLWRGETLRVPTAVLVLLLAAGGFFALDLYFWHRSILLVGAGVSTLLANFQVFVLAAAALVLFGQRPGRVQLLAMPLALAGLALLLGVDGRLLAPGQRAGVAFGLLTAVAYAAYILSLQAVRLRASGSVMRDVALASLVAAAGLGLLALAGGESLRVSAWRDAGLLGAYALCSTVFGWVLITSSLTRLTAAHVGLVLLLQPVLSFAWDVLLFARGFTAAEAGGAALALLAIWLGSRPAAATAPDPSDAGRPVR